MTRAAQLVIRVGDATDVVAGAARDVPGQLRSALAQRRHRRAALGVSIGYLLLYLLAIRDLAISASGRYAGLPAFDVVPDWTGRLLEERAPFLYEPVVAIHPIPQLAVLVSPGNLLVGLVIGLLLGANVALVAHAARVRACRRRGAYAGALGAVAPLLMGFSCCAPTFILLLGAEAAAALLPAFVPARPYLLPSAIATMALMLVWSAGRATTPSASHHAPP